MIKFRYQDEGGYRYLLDNEESIFKDTRAIPFAAVVLSISAQILYVLLRWVVSLFKRNSTPTEFEEEDVTTRPSGLAGKLRKHIESYGGWVIYGFMVSRFAGSVALYVLSRNTLVKCESDPLADCPEAFFTITYLYSVILGFVALVSKRRRVSATRHNIFILLCMFGVYAYRDLWPLATYTQQPADIAEGDILFVKLGVLVFTAIVIPLFVPRQYVPVDPKNPMPEPNPEQTASIISLFTYTFLNSTIYLGAKVPHLRADQLPPLCDYDAAKYQTEKAFPHLDAYNGAKHRSMFLRLMRVFRVEYTVLAIAVVGYSLGSFASPVGMYQILNYLESDGAGATIRPWVWIIWLFLGPMVQSLSFQWYIFIATRTLARTELLITQLVFEHSLRIRLKAETTNSPSKSQVGTPVETSRAPSPIEGRESSSSADESTDSDEASERTSLVSESTAREASEGSTVAAREPSATSSTTSAKKAGKAKAAKAKAPEPVKQEPPKKSEGNLIGKINNLVTTDLNNITGARDFLLVVLYVPMQMVLCLVFLYNLLGWSTFVGFGVMLALLPVPGWVAKKIRQVQVEKMKMTDARVQAVSEAMNVIRMVKLFGWEGKMSERLQDKREKEVKLIWKTKLLNFFNGMMGFTFPTFTMLASFAVYTLIMKQELNSSKIFSSMAVFSMLREQLFRLLWQSSTIIQGKVSLDRLDDFLNKTELLDSFLEASDSKALLPVPATAELNQNIGFKNASFSWSLEDEGGSATPSGRIFRLRVDGELVFKRDAINLIVGPTGSGKTSMLMALLGEMHFIPTSPDYWYNLPRSGGVAYAAQESWLQNQSIRDNILFGAEYDEERYNKVIKQCALERDLELFEAGDATEVGERGLTLSGGQKARVTLARAIYSPADIILLDDVFAALDVHTSSWIVENCFRGDLVKNRTILLVTHNLAIASPVADFIVSIAVDGTVQSQGTDLTVALKKDPKLALESQEDKETTEISEENLRLNPPAEEAKKKSSDGKLVIAEEIAQGHVSWKAIKLMLKALGGDHPLIFFTICSVALVLNEWTLTLQVWFLGYWGSQYETHPASEVKVPLYISVYCGFVGLFCVFYALSYLFFMYGSVRASRHIHNVLVDSLFGSTLRWLDETPTGRIITRCTQDIRAIDGPVPQAVLWLIDTVTCMFTKLGAVVLFTPIFLGPGAFIAIVGFYLGNMYLKAQLSVKRETSNARAPLLSHFSAAIHGLVSIRAYGAQDKFKVESLLRINHYTKVSRMSYNLNRWIGVRIDALGSSFTAALAWYLIYGPRVGAANTGFSLSMAIEFTSQILYIVRIYNDFEVQSNSLERIQGYIDIEHEPKPTEAGKPPASWPTSGELRVEKLSARYSQAGPKVLHDISFHIPSGQRVGVVGRTGSGKSSLTLALLRCILTEGEVYFDGLPTHKINLDALRSSLTIIPQTPELLSGTLRENLDPFDQNDDAVLNDALHAAGLFSLQEEAGEASIQLDTKIASGGGNLSVGQRQIIALARAMVRGSKLLILDEATSAIDYKTDAIIQNTLRGQLAKDVTVITVAHRLQTIMDADKIMVLDNGRIAEFGAPKDLLKNKDGMLRSLVDESGDKEKLYELAAVVL